MFINEDILNIVIDALPSNWQTLDSVIMDQGTQLIIIQLKNFILEEELHRYNYTFVGEEVL